MPTGSETLHLAGTGPRPGPILALWAAIVVLVGIATWVTGLRPAELRAAIEAGAARVETSTKGESSEDAIRKAIHTQRDTLRFWKTLALLDDFVIEPLAPAVRAFALTIAMTALAMLVGRPGRYAEALLENSRGQVWWVVGLAARAGLMIGLKRADVETSATLLLPSGTYPAALWAALQQLDAFAAIGWTSLAWGGWRRGQANLVVATIVVLILWSIEASLRIFGSLVLGAGMRLTLIPEL